MKIFIGTVNIASQLNDWKVGFERNGCKVLIGSYNNNSNLVTDSADIKITKYHNYKITRSYTLDKIVNMSMDIIYGDARRKLLFRLIKDYDVFFFIWNSLLDNYEDLKIIKDAGKKIIIQFVGDDIRWYTTMKQEFVRNGLTPIEYDAYDHSVVNLNQKLTYLRNCEKFADLIFSAKNQHQLGLRLFGVNPQLINAEDFEFKSNLRKIPIVAHFPSSSSFKGTRFILDVINKLKKEVDFEFISSGNEITYSSNKGVIPYDEIKKVYSNIDILVGQLLCPGGGKQERELLASGKIVLSNMSSYYESHIPEGNPIIDVDPNNLAEKLKEVILDYEKRCALAKRGRPYVEQFHDPVKITARILEELTTGEYLCPTYQPTFFREEFIPESSEYVEVYNYWTKFVDNEDWYRQSVTPGERAGLIF